jgi:hypothetical protein
MLCSPSCCNTTAAAALPHLLLDLRPVLLPCASPPSAQKCAEALAVGLGLRSIAQLDGFVNADTGELIVRDVKTSPALTDGSPLLQQVGGKWAQGFGSDMH